jgi:hypothetical protein
MKLAKKDKKLQVAKEFEEAISDEEVEYKKEYVIPMIQNNQYKDATKPEPKEKQKYKDDKQFGLMIPKKRELESQGDSSTLKPLLLQNKIPGIDQGNSESEKYRIDVNQRPDDCDESVYKRIPIEHFGEALLKGMGWSKGKPIGKNPNG